VRIGLWEKIDLQLLQPASTTTGAVSPTTTGSLGSAIRSIVAELFGWLVWGYIFVKLFVIDFDSLIAQHLFPDHRNLIYYKVFGVIIIAAVTLLVARKALGWVLYVVFFPFVVIFWKIPRIIYRTRSWIVFFAVANAVVHFFQDLPRNFAVWTVSLLACLVILVKVHSGVVILAAAVFLVLHLFSSFYRAIKQSFTPSAFIRLQQNAIQQVTKSDAINRACHLNDTLKNDSITKFNKEQLTALTTSLQYGIMANRGFIYWAYQLERYRTSGTPQIFAVITYFRLFIQTIFAFSVLNMAVFQFNPNAYMFSRPPGFLAFVHYSLSSLFVNEISGLSASSTTAMILKIAGGIVGPLLLGTLILNLMIGRKQSSQDSEMKSVIAQLKRQGAQLEAQIENEYEISLHDAMKKLADMHVGFIAFVYKWSSDIPKDF
jgi:hypothetical protein